MSLKRFFFRNRWDDERARELEAHLAIETDDNIARGMTPEDARLAAQRKLGNRTLVREEISHMNTISFLDSAWRDLRYGARLLRLNPSFAIVAILSLALGVGANTAIFQLLDAVRLRTLPVRNPEELVEVRIGETSGGRTGSFVSRRPTLTNPLWEQIRDHQQAFSSTFAYSNVGFNLTTGGEARYAQGIWASGEYFNTLGVSGLVGRTLTSNDDRRGCQTPPAVISYGFWQREYAGSPSVIGRSLRLDGHAYDIVGVPPASFFGMEVGRTFDVVVPLCAEPLTRGARSGLDKPDTWFVAVFGRLNPGWSIERATSHLASLSPAMFKTTLPTRYGAEDAKHYLNFKLAAFPAGTGVSSLRRNYESPLWLLLATTGLVLLIACANLANLMLARATAREREVAVRLAIGASRGRIVRQMLAESLLIAAIGAVCGAALAQWLSRFLVEFLNTDNNRIFVALSLDWRIFEDITSRVAALPGIQSAAQAFIVPVSGSGWNNSIVINGAKPKSAVVNFNSVSANYFRTMATPILMGRDFDDRHDTLTSEKVAIVTESFVKKYFAGQNPIGQTFQIEEPPGAPRPLYQIVGVAKDMKYTDLREAFGPIGFFPAAQGDPTDTSPFMQIVLRSNAPMNSITSQVSAAVTQVNASIILRFQTMKDQVRESLLRERLMATLSGFFGALAGLIATIGLYGVMSYMVARGRNEIGIRMALGADRRDVVRMVMREAGLLLGAGLVVGGVMAVMAARAASTLLFGLQPGDPSTLAMSAVALAAAAMLASYLPALRASRLEPTEALREE